MRGRADDFEDDGASFRVRRIAQLERQMRVAAFHQTPTFKLIRRLDILVLIFAIPFGATLLIAFIEVLLGI